jgi:hypothetical protein
MQTEYLNNHLKRTAQAQVSNDDASAELIAKPTSSNTDYNFWLWLEEINYAVWKPSQEGGHLEIIDASGDVVWKINTDGVKEGKVNFGGLRIGQNDSLEAVVSGSPNFQASCSVSVKAYTTRRKEYYGY